MFAANSLIVEIVHLVPGGKGTLCVWTPLLVLGGLS
jgi:hypothetical protein